MIMRMKTVLCNSLIFAFLLWNGCGIITPTEPVPDIGAAINIVTMDETGKPLVGVLITTFPNTSKRLTDATGKAVLNDIPPGKYQIALVHPAIPLTYQDIIIRSNETKDISFKIATIVSINILVITTAGKPVKDMVITTSPPTVTVITDEEGRAVIENVPVRFYSFFVKRMGLYVMSDSRLLIIRNGKLEDIVLELESQYPLVTILSPPDNYFQQNRDIILSGRAYDFEDLELTGSSMVWRSNIDGFLGIGEELAIDYLSVGHHTITLTGIDSVNNETTRSIMLNLHTFEKNSYFPIPWRGSWTYHFENPEFTVLNDDGTTENWNLSDLYVVMEDMNTRNCSLNYTVTKGSQTTSYHYYLVDYFENDEENIYISRTTEQLQVNNKKLDLDTTYSPRYTAIRNYMSPQIESFYETTVTAEVTWIYSYVSQDKNPYSEIATFTTAVETGIPEPVDTGLGSIEALPLTITVGETARKWWLAQGIGLVRLEFDTLYFSLAANLHETNIFDFSDDGLIHKRAAGSHRTGSQGVVKRFSTSADTPEGMRERCAFLRDLCPR